MSQELIELCTTNMCILDVTSVAPINAHFLFITYLYHVSPSCFGVSHTIFKQNLRGPYSETPVFTQLLYIVHWLRHKYKGYNFAGLQ